MKRDELNKRLLKALFDSNEQLLLGKWMKQAPLYQLDHSNDDHDYQKQLKTAYHVAQIVLSMTLKTLPNWGLKQRIGSDQRIQSSKLEPTKLFEINWATSAPGFEWPESYYVTYLPGYDIYLVTLSNDSSDTLGYTDLAIGFFKSANHEINSNSAALIKQWWSSLKKSGQDHWSEVIASGIIMKNDVISLRDDIWKL